MEQRTPEKLEAPTRTASGLRHGLLAMWAWEQAAAAPPLTGEAATLIRRAFQDCALQADSPLPGYPPRVSSLRGSGRRAS